MLKKRESGRVFDVAGIKGLNGPSASAAPAKRGRPKPNGPLSKMVEGAIRPSRPKAQAAPRQTY